MCERKPRKLIDEVSINEMKTMREQGMTNREISAALDVDYKTILRHIGKQPPGMGGSREWAKPIAKRPNHIIIAKKEQEQEAIATGSGSYSLSDYGFELESERIVKRFENGTKFTGVLQYMDNNVVFNILHASEDYPYEESVTFGADEMEDAAKFLMLCARRMRERTGDFPAQQVNTQADAEEAQADEKIMQDVDVAHEATTNAAVAVDKHDSRKHYGLTYVKCEKCGDGFFFHNKYGSVSTRCKKCGEIHFFDKAVKFRATCDCGAESYGWAQTNENEFAVKCKCGKEHTVVYNEQENEFRNN